MACAAVIAALCNTEPEASVLGLIENPEFPLTAGHPESGRLGSLRPLLLLWLRHRRALDPVLLVEPRPIILPILVVDIWNLSPVYRERVCV